MREILFKAKRVDNRKWAEGIPIKAKDSDEARMLFPLRTTEDGDILFDCIKIDPSTICQYTGLIDRKNGIRKSKRWVYMGMATCVCFW